MTMRLHHGMATSVTVDTNEGAWELRIEDNDGFVHVFNIHGVSAQFACEAKQVADWWAEGIAAARQHAIDLETVAARDEHDRAVDRLLGDA